jgi:hypothetical protein
MHRKVGTARLIGPSTATWVIAIGLARDISSRRSSRFNWSVAARQGSQDRGGYVLRDVVTAEPGTSSHVMARRPPAQCDAAAPVARLAGLKPATPSSCCRCPTAPNRSHKAQNSHRVTPLRSRTCRTCRRWRPKCRATMPDQRCHRGRFQARPGNRVVWLACVHQASEPSGDSAGCDRDTGQARSCRTTIYRQHR